MGDVFQEVDEDIRKDRIKSIWKRYRIFFILFLLFVISAVCFNSFWTQYKLKKVEERSEKYFFAMDEATVNAQKGVDALKIFSDEENDSSYHALLANLKEAAIWRSKNDLHNALNIYKNILGNNIEQVYKNYVQIQLVEVLMELGNLEEAKIILSDVSITNTAFASLAKEYIGYIAMQEGDLIKAKNIFEELTEGATTPITIKNRVKDILVTIK